MNSLKNQLGFSEEKEHYTETQIMNPIASSTSQRKPSSHRFASLSRWELKQEEGNCQEKPIIAQPVFVFEKRKQAFKRPAEDPLYKAECEFNYSRKRGRPPSLSFQTVDSASYRDPLKQSLQRHFLRPAILQPPATQTHEERREMCGDDALGLHKVKETMKSQFPEGGSCLLRENSVRSESLSKSSICRHILSPTPKGRQLDKDKTSFKSITYDFVFGENMVERVLSYQKCQKPPNEKDFYHRGISSKSTGALLIRSPCPRSSPIRNTTLSESAAAYDSKPIPEYFLEKVNVLTGEEAEHNVLQINCKIFIFNKTTQSWIEKGRGTLRLNDTASNKLGTLQSRLVMRNQGNLRLILNTKLWAQMELQRANSKSLRITATDLKDSSIRVFLVQARAKDAGCLYAAIHHRLVALRSLDKQESDGNQVETEPKPVFQLLSCDSCDEEDDDRTQITRSNPSKWARRQSVACP
ncbi:ran-binding protein 3-like [Tachyglossus aculeatus]|uniref:ran-binding protein 3-like n=1 Tax=Tachyglossus aculeatus TaxID=9261 RepID=UPI0018F5DE60|nr:ran-binding protein 3-like [Tachyglossus aculeatus]